MKIVIYKPGASQPEVFEPKGNSVRIGRAPENDIVLSSHLVAPQAVLLECRDDKWEMVVRQFKNVWLDDQELKSGQRVALAGTQRIKVLPIDLVIKLPDRSKGENEGFDPRLSSELADLIRDVHRQLREQQQSRACIDRIQEGVVHGHDVSDSDLLQLEQFVDELVRLQGLLKPERQQLTTFSAGLCVQGELLQSLVEPQSAGQPPAWYLSQHWSRMVSQVPVREFELKGQVNILLEAMDARRSDSLSQQLDAVQDRFWKTWQVQTKKMHPELTGYLALRQLKKELKDMLFGLGPLEDLLKIPAISEIMVVDRDHIYVERSGRIEKSGRRFVSDDVTVNVINRIVRKVGRSINTSEPLVDARMPDGSRVNAVIPPLAVSGPCLTIRRFPEKRLRIDDLVCKQTLSGAVAEFLKAAVVCKKNIIISGGTGSGKTTLLNCLADSIPEGERIITIEDTAELQIPREHRVRLEARKANLEKEGAFTIGDLVRNALRMRPDRIVVGECRGAEAMDMLQAMNTGHSGSMTTIHANTTADVIQRLEVLVQMADVKLPVSSIHRQIVSAIDLIVQLSRLHDGARRVTQVSEVLGMDEETDEVTLRHLFLLDETAAKTELRATGHLPSFMGELIDLGLLQLQNFYLDAPGKQTP